MPESDTVPTGSTAEHIVESPATSTAKDVIGDPTTSTAEDIIDTPTGTSTAGDIIEDPVSSTEEDILEDPVTSTVEDTIENPTIYTAEDILENATAVYKPGDLIQIGQRPSQFDRPVTFSQDQSFANVIGSSGDKKVKHLAWLRLWEQTFNTRAVVCSSKGFPRGFQCSDPKVRLVGGHVIKGKKDSRVPPGSNNVYIIPICQKHNLNKDVNVHMAAITERRAVKLKDYHDP